MKDQDIIQAALEKCMSLYDKEMEMTHPREGDDSFYGNPPRAMLIKYGEGSLRKMEYLVTDIRKIWYYEGGELTELDGMRKRVTEPISGMYFAEAEAVFAMDKERKYLYLSFSMGPRYARGIRYTIEGQSNSVTFYEEKLLWIS